MKRPWIGIPAGYHEKSEYIGQVRHYFDAVLWAGGLPLLIPTIGDPKTIGEYVDRVQGVLLPGSPTDIEPGHYGEAAHSRIGRLCPERDSTDFAVLDFIGDKDIPVLGICFGAQSLNVHRGGSLVQDIPSVVSNSVSHDEDDGKPPARHTIRIVEDSWIRKFAGQAEVEVNSYHHQSVQNPGRNLRPAATATDGVIEAVEDTTGRFIIGVQWHPERGWKEDPLSRALFSAFIEEARLGYNQ